MKLISRLFVAMLVVGLILTAPSGVAAKKRIFKANLTSTAETHEVIQGNARGSSLIRYFPDGSVEVEVIVRNLTGPAAGIHLHAPALPGSDAPVYIPLCGSGASAFGACPDPDVNNVITLSGAITPSVLQTFGATGRNFLQYLNDGMMYVNVHTALNPMGEARGQYADITP